MNGTTNLQVMAKNKHIDDDPVFLLRGDDDEIYYIDDPEVIDILNAKIQSMKGKSDKVIGKELLKMVNPERYGKVL
jgi:glutamate-1-semialdehyde aminotransferase